MTCDLVALAIRAHDPLALARFWNGLLGWAPRSDVSTTLVPNDDTGFELRFVPTDQEKVVQNPLHLDLTSQTLEQQRQTVATALALGARHIDVGQTPDDGHVVLADPEGNEFCVIEPGNNFLADCGFLGALACDGTRAVGQFWSRALGWPLVWDQDEETAIRSPHGGPKITWGGPPLMPREGEDRLLLELAPSAGRDQAGTVDLLLALGATHHPGGRADGDVVVLADPDGNELHVLPARP